MSSYQPFPKPQFGNVHCGQFKHKPPSPNLANSSAVIGSLATSRGSTKSKTVLFAYMTHPGKPTMGVSPLYDNKNIAPGKTGEP